MDKRTIVLMIINVVLFNVGLVVISVKKDRVQKQEQIVQVEPEKIEIKPKIETKYNYKIAQPVPDYLDYQQTVSQLKEWNDKAPEITKLFSYGKSTDGTDLWCFNINGKSNEKKQKVLITACIHGNEPLSASTVMAYIGTLLDKYNDDDQITKIIDSRDLYFVPVVSPDSYPNSRNVDGVDPNRNFPTRGEPNKESVAPVAALQKLFKDIEPNAVISGHTYGQIYLTPWGDQIRISENDEDFKRIVGEMGRLSKYDMQRACEMYSRPIYGTEIDWYYRKGAFAIVMEFGTHQRIPSSSEINDEFERTFKAVLYFIEEAPEIQIRHLVPFWEKSAA